MGETGVGARAGHSTLGVGREGVAGAGVWMLTLHMP